jgi:hypothetical protein
VRWIKKGKKTCIWGNLFWKLYAYILLLYIDIIYLVEIIRRQVLCHTHHNINKIMYGLVLIPPCHHTRLMSRFMLWYLLSCGSIYSMHNPRINMHIYNWLSLLQIICWLTLAVVTNTLQPSLTTWTPSLPLIHDMLFHAQFKRVLSSHCHVLMLHLK